MERGTSNLKLVKVWAVPLEPLRKPPEPSLAEHNALRDFLLATYSLATGVCGFASFAVR